MNEQTELLFLKRLKPPHVQTSIRNISCLHFENDLQNHHQQIKLMSNLFVPSSQAEEITQMNISDT